MNFDKLDKLHKEKNELLFYSILFCSAFILAVVSLVVSIIDKDIASVATSGVLAGFSFGIAISSIGDFFYTKKEIKEETNRILEELRVETIKMLDKAIAELDKQLADKPQIVEKANETVKSKSKTKKK